MNSKKRIYIAGCGGMLGEAFYKVFGENYDLKCTDIDVNEEWLSHLDFRDFQLYLNDVENMPRPMEHPRNMSSAGSKSLRGIL